MHLILAPLHGFTDSTFRNVYFKHFHALDEAMAPFISLTHADKITPLKVRELLPLNNHFKALIPQILGNETSEFILLCNYLSDELGYTEVNWNLGCPIRGIVNKKRGSGILPYPELIDSLLSEIIPSIRLKLSVKLRLGLNSAEEFPAVIDVLNKYPLSNITLHPRIGIQQYEGTVMLDEFEGMLPLIHHSLIYNGDIHRYDQFVAISNRFPAISSFMLGRGIFHNPFLPEMIREGKSVLPAGAEERYSRYYRELEDTIKTEKHFWMSKMKEYWKYFGAFMHVDEKSLLELLRCKDEMEWNRLTSLHLNRFMEGAL
ncbi:MAG: tRNA-dihydrouridine synthase family protein [Bacteroidales bacterium]|nr:tRNA-dihydrouridine synthase family protein [Bacteroidales bacterium]